MRLDFFRKTKAKSLYDSILDQIKGLGKKRKQQLIEHFKTIDEIKKASIASLSQVLPMEIAKKLKQKLDQS